MLLRFRCKNFRSLREEQELSLVAAKTRSAEKDETLLLVPGQEFKALRCAAIYGANASGKSNVLRALAQFSRIVSNSQRKWEPTGPIPAWDPFVLDDSSRSGEASFEIDFVIDSVVYTYGFRFNERTFVEEWLEDNTARTKTLFRRKSGGATVSVSFPGKNLGVTSEEAKLLDLIRLQTRPNSLFLASAAQGNHEFLGTIFRWITQRFYILRPTDEFSRSYTAKACAKPDRKQKIKALLAAADVGIADFQIAEEKLPDHIKQAFAAAIKVMEAGSESAKVEALQENFFTRDEITMLHRGGDEKNYPLPFDDESSGTRAYFFMLGPILQELEEGSVLLMDELESSLHPMLARAIVQMFNDPKLNPRGAQLIFATHAVSLFSLDLMRRDQIWITDKAKSGATILSALSDFQPRREQNVSSAYLHGRFGGVPVIDENSIRSTLAPFAELESAADGDRNKHGQI